MEKLGQYFTQWRSNPDILVEVAWFHLCFYFGNRGREGWASMTKDTFVFEQDAEGHEYVAFAKTETTKNIRVVTSRGTLVIRTREYMGRVWKNWSTSLGNCILITTDCSSTHSWPTNLTDTGSRGNRWERIRWGTLYREFSVKRVCHCATPATVWGRHHHTISHWHRYTKH